MAQLHPIVSAIVPCYNAGSTLERCLTSILEQTYPVGEILVYDDCSTDDSATVLANMARKHPSIRVFSGEKNEGAGYARTTLLRAAKGSYLAFLDADDVWHPRKIEVQLNLMTRYKADIGVCDYDVFDEKGHRLGTRRLPKSITRFKMHLQNEIPTSMAVLRSDINGCRVMPMLRTRQDYAYWLSIFAQNPGITCVSTREVLGSYYRMPASLSSNAIENLKANYHMFRSTQGYSFLFSSICVCANGVLRIMRS